MQHVVCHVEKCQTVTTGLGQHVDRLRMPDNADPERTRLNEDLTPKKSDNLTDDVNRRIAEGYKGKKGIRKDAVKAFRIILSGSNERMKEIEQNPQEFQKWKDMNVQFMQEKFGADNLVRMSLHMDETTPHIHAIVVPITKDGRLSAKDFIDGPKGMRDLQTQYAKAMEVFGLSRGKENSTAKHTDIAEYYGRVNRQADPFEIDIPQAKMLENPDKHAQRVKLALSPLQETLERSKRTLGELRQENYYLKQENERLEMKNQIAFANVEGLKLTMQADKNRQNEEIKKATAEGVRIGQQQAIDAINRLLAPEKRRFEIDHERKQLKLVPIEEKKQERKNDPKKDFGLSM